MPPGVQRLQRQLAALEELARSDGAFAADRLARIAAEGTGSEAAVLHLLDGDPHNLSGTHGDAAELTEALASQPARAGPLLRRSVSGRWLATLPLRGSDGPAGALGLSRGPEAPFLPDELAEARALADVLVMALERARLKRAAHEAVAQQTRLLEQERRRARDLALINELGNLLSSELDLRTVLEIGVRQLARIADVPQVFVMLMHEGRLTIDATNVEGAGVLGLEVPTVEPSLTRRCIELRTPLISNDPLSDPHASPGHTRRFGQTAIVVVPLVSRGEPLGAVLLGETNPERKFTQAEVERAVALAHPLATVIANARLFEDLKRRNAELATAQLKLVRRERLAALGELAAVVAHEVRNPLAVIFNSLATLRRPATDRDQARMLLDIVGEESERLNRIVGELLAFSRPGEPRLSSQPLEPVLQGAAEAAQSGLQARVRIVMLDAPLPAVRIDAQLVRQALLNLLSNAAQAFPGGEIQMVVREERDAGRRSVRVDVADQGPGIPESVAAQMFEPFFTTRAQGTGLGLAIVKRIVESHGGEVHYAARQPAGSVFTLRLPVEEAR